MHSMCKSYSKTVVYFIHAPSVLRKKANKKQPHGAAMLSSAMTQSNPKHQGSLRQPSLLHTSRSAACICQLSRRRISVSCHAFQLSMDNIYDKMEFGLKPYNFEPEYTEEELAELATASDENSGNDDSLQQTCRCTHCRFQTAIVEEEKTCCVDNTHLTVSNIEDYCCITDHPSFHTIVLNRTVLEVAYIQSLAYKRSHVTAPSVLSNRYVPLSLCFFEVAIKTGEGRAGVLCRVRAD